MISKIETLLKPTKTKRFLFFLLSDIFLFTISFILAFLLRFDFNIPDNYKSSIIFWTPIFVFVKIGVLYLSNIYNINWRFVSLRELFKISFDLFLVSFIFFIINWFLQLNLNHFSIPKSIIIIDFAISLILIGILRISKRIYLEIFSVKKSGKNTLIIGIGATGERIARGLIKDTQYNPVAFVDDDPNKIGTIIHGIPVLGKIKDIPYIIKENKIETVILAIPSLNHKDIKKIHNLIKDLGTQEIKIVPSLKNLPENIEITVKSLKDISIEDLLFREEIKIDRDQIFNLLKNKKILVTGAGGSIGSEIVRQLIDFKPNSIIAFEIDETELHNLTLELSEKLKNSEIEFIPIVGDVKDIEKLDKIFQKYIPDIIFHAAAYKHVPLMEYFPEEAVKTNVFGTYNLTYMSIKYNVKKFINISTDKAVNPTSIMGATKRFAEIICNSFNQLNKTKFISVRFGNVLGSRGSVIPIFLEQIKKGGPVTVTHPEMKRYFMTIPEAVLLVFQAAAMGSGGEVFVLDMGEEVKIVALAEELIKLQNLEPYKDIDIIFTGLRAGEKLFEELLTAEEGTDKTYHEKVYIARNPQIFSLEELNDYLDKLKNISVENPEEIKKFLGKIVPFYQED
ncbi:nucleoside-diphosphate sugar epimerase/dehydratase [Nitrosophilus kaiyonis]|uniref:nucleoside-diphosphate sugar epimerase/dehydratase n=1 Tax=Nitrosophilus kaiyonis TaxID=2930200 RepID=UPI0024906766|nr:nucleoside-diphosphate sugar epimerase/dehydratase [Nitrosophilus kaiyonis]